MSCNIDNCKLISDRDELIEELEQQKADLINILKSIAKMKENDENELSRIAKEIIDILEKYK